MTTMMKRCMTTSTATSSSMGRKRSLMMETTASATTTTKSSVKWVRSRVSMGTLESSLSYSSPVCPILTLTTGRAIPSTTTTLHPRSKFSGSGVPFGRLTRKSWPNSCNS
ncbi:hypothetical protein BN1708_018027 [Verticillium longisporum]|uniref:Uncharacterized protein n=1 Tax=Verticillium longisporum TaxID=100787 RepID=A0A0G4LMS7_VERLO|nr:hypothetical protein BN1708_018027 [Verticillium longisporum]